MTVAGLRRSLAILSVLSWPMRVVAPTRVKRFSLTWTVRLLGPLSMSRSRLKSSIAG